MTRTWLLAGLLLATSCTTVQPMRSEITTDSGRPLSPGLKAYDVEHYTLRNEILIEQKSIAGSAAIRFRAVRPMSTLELDFDGLFDIQSIEDESGPLDYTRDPARIYVTLRAELPIDAVHEVEVFYSGAPIEAKHAPWDG